MKTRVCIVGAGAAGMSCAYALSKHPDKYEVTIFDKQPEAGGMATSIPIDAERYGASYINDGVQGCSPAFANTIKMFRLLGYECAKVGMQISFGNQTPYVSSAILARVFLDPSMRLFEFDDRSLLASIPTMFAFPRLGDVYRTWQREIEKTGATFKLGCEVKNVGGELESETFDELVMATDADTALKILGKSATWMERQVLGSVKYLYDVTITHNDLEYMNKHYETSFKDSLAAEPHPEYAKEDQEAVELGRKEFKPLYYTKQYEDDKRKIEMSFDLTHYQPQFKGIASTPGEKGLDHTPHDEKPMEQHVFQTIFLDRDSSEGMWTWNEIPKEKRIYEKWWKQQSHRWQHYAKVVPWMMFINGKNHTHFAGAWSVLNMHELAVTSGGDDECERLFKLYLALSHGARARREDRKGFFV
ncbi:hypothetical protein OPQ81_008201 [Rhizoctonia solani]|nr:hypothetical protein OPQ81_008201 [Rhizoctonia solani]